MPLTLNLFSARGGVVHGDPSSRNGHFRNSLWIFSEVAVYPDDEAGDVEFWGAAGRLNIFGAPPAKQVVNQIVGGAVDTLAALVQSSSSSLERSLGLAAKSATGCAVVEYWKTMLLKDASASDPHVTGTCGKVPNNGLSVCRKSNQSCKPCDANVEL